MTHDELQRLKDAVVEVSIKGEVVTMNEEDFEKFKSLRWRISSTGRNKYVRVALPSGTETMLHRLVIDAPKHLQVDHINGNGLDNRRCNLRLATQQQNTANRTRMTPNGTGFRGVHKNTHGEKFYAGIAHLGNRTMLGSYSTPQEAAAAYDLASILLNGDFAATNFPREIYSINLELIKSRVLTRLSQRAGAPDRECLERLK